MKIETDYWSAIPVDYDELVKFAEEATDEIERLEDVAKSYRKTANELATRVAQTEEEIEQARTTSQYWKSEHIEANAEIDRLRNIISAARECLDADDVIGAIEILEKNND